MVDCLYISFMATALQSFLLAAGSGVSSAACSQNNTDLHRRSDVNDHRGKSFVGRQTSEEE